MEIELINDDTMLDHCAELMAASDPWTTLQFGSEKCKLAMRGEHKEVYVTRMNGKFAGFVVLQLNGQLRGYIQTICLVPEFRSKGLGTTLLQFSKERLLKISPNVFLCVSSFNHKAQQLYKQLGFEKIGTLSDHIVKGYDEYILRYSIGPVSEFTPTAG